MASSPKNDIVSVNEGAGNPLPPEELHPNSTQHHEPITFAYDGAPVVMPNSFAVDQYGEGAGIIVPLPPPSTPAHQQPADVGTGGAASEGFEKPPSRRTSSDSCDWDAAVRLLGRQCPTSAAKLEGCSEPSGGGGNTPRGGAKASGGGAHQVAAASDGGGVHPMVEEAWERLKKSYVYYKGDPVGTLAATDPGAEALNYNQVVDLLSRSLSSPVQKDEKSKPGREALEADYGGTAIGRVAPIDSGFWWIILLRSYTKRTRDYSLTDMPEVQRGIKLILNLCLSDGFDTFPTLLCADGCCMIDRRMGIYGYPIEIQALFFFALRSAKQMLKEGPDNKELLDKIVQKIKALNYHIRNYYWLDHTQLNNIYRYRTEEYSHTAVNKFNVMPESIPDWLFEFIPLRGGYFIGNVSPARMDFRWFLVGNFLLWMLTSACIKIGRPQMAKKAIDLIEKRLAKDGWPEYYDGKTGLYIGKQARKYQTWSIAGYLVAKMMIENPANLLLVSLEEDKSIAKPKLTRSASWS
ncbi:hypothetical protein Cgig2_031051 [Carnegiea gigantea]|uniref:Alkaline/neutral invertase n=1 Tax=Carnegiea gigantea TaxID=171969 RepID=A0A9Q1KCY7_9CARY|nr:hypothetical protein Cgig2_031051 [Carnegiea gigantea]